MKLHVEKDGTKVVVKVNMERSGHHIRFPYTFSFSYDCGQGWIADLLYMELDKQLKDTVQEIREGEYKQGLKDSRKKAKDRKDWFYPGIG